jgi:hypothetical protein
MISAAVQPNDRSAPPFTLTIAPWRSLVTMASPEKLTIAVKRWASS